VARYDGLEVLLGLQRMDLQLVKLVEPVQQLLRHRDVLGLAQLLLGIREAGASAPQTEPPLLLLLLQLLLLAQLVLQLLYFLLLLLYLNAAGTYYRMYKNNILKGSFLKFRWTSSQCCGSGSVIRCYFDPWTRIRDLGSRISTPYFLELSDKFLGEKIYISFKTGPIFFSSAFINKIIFNFVKFVAAKKGLTTNFFSPLSFVAVFGSGIRDPDKHPGSATLPAAILIILLGNICVPVPSMTLVVVGT
jgi:hypothetical protein